MLNHGRTEKSDTNFTSYSTQYSLALPIEGFDIYVKGQKSVYFTERALSPNRDNFLELDVYFEEMQVTLITQRQAYDQESLFGELYRAAPSHEHVIP